MRHIIKKETFVQEFIKNFVPSISVEKLKKLNCYAPNHGYLYNVKSLKAGVSQLSRYRRTMGKGYTWILELY